VSEEELADNYIEHYIKERNTALCRGQALVAIYYQGGADSMAQYLTELQMQKEKRKNGNGREVQ
jgi:hypothetical protein